MPKVLVKIDCEQIKISIQSAVAGYLGRQRGMRITETEKKVLTGAVWAIDANAKVWLFGSRVDDTKKGGDIDIAVLSRNIGIVERMKIRRNIVDNIGEQKIDIVVSADGSDPFFRLAVEKGISLHE
jgi:predicted nucleotidyltransferase